MALSSRPLSALAALLLLSSDAGAFSIGASSSRRAAVATRLAAKGGMDAYDAQMKAMAGGGSPAPPPAADATVDEVAAEMLNSSRELSNADATASSPPAGFSSSAIGGGGAASTEAAYAAIAALEASQSRSVADIASSIPDLTVKPDSSYSPAASGSTVVGDAASGFTVVGSAVKLVASDAAGPANVAWLSDLCVDGAMSSLTIFNGPLTDVPHLISRCAVDDEELKFFLDFRPRAYGAYDLRDAGGNYPGPDTLGRKAFEYSGARKDFDSKFGTEEVVGYLEDAVSKFEGAVANPGLGDESLSELEKLTRGPLAIDVTMPLSENNVNTIMSVREKAASLWLGWALDSSHSHRPGAPINSQYVYDSKYKINAYGTLLDVYVDLFGQSEGEKLAAADSGPIDEAYVGGGS